MIGSTYLAHGQPVRILARWLSRPKPGPVVLAFGCPQRGTPRNVLIVREQNR